MHRLWGVWYQGDPPPTRPRHDAADTERVHRLWGVWYQGDPPPTRPRHDAADTERVHRGLVIT